MRISKQHTQSQGAHDRKEGRPRPRHPQFTREAPTATASTASRTGTHGSTTARKGTHDREKKHRGQSSHENSLNCLLRGSRQGARSTTEAPTRTTQRARQSTKELCPRNPNFALDQERAQCLPSSKESCTTDAHKRPFQLISSVHTFQPQSECDWNSLLFLIRALSKRGGGDDLRERASSLLFCGFCRILGDRTSRPSCKP